MCQPHIQDACLFQDWHSLSQCVFDGFWPGTSAQVCEQRCMPSVGLCTANSARPHRCWPRWKNQRGPSCSTCTGFNPLSRALKLRMPFSFVASWRRPSSPADIWTSHTPGACLGQGGSGGGAPAPWLRHQASWPSLQPLHTCLTIGPVVVGAHEHVCPALPGSHLSCMVTADLSTHQAKQDQAGVERRSVFKGAGQSTAKSSSWECRAHIVEAFQVVVLVLAEQQRRSKTVHGGVAAWLRQRMTATWQILQVTKGGS